jgi:hypothetical protein
MISRLFLRVRTWLILFIFIALNISIPNATDSELTEPQDRIELACGDTHLGNTESDDEIDNLLEVILEEGFSLTDFFPEGEWSTEETTVVSQATFDIISIEIVSSNFYPPGSKRISPNNVDLPDDQFIKKLKRPPENGTYS